MIKSMTGFGVATIVKPSENINLEIKSLNSRNLDIRFSGLNISAESVSYTHLRAHET